jgi:hypothetical protein
MEPEAIGECFFRIFFTFLPFRNLNFLGPSNSLLLAFLTFAPFLSIITFRAIFHRIHPRPRPHHHPPISHLSSLKELSQGVGRPSIPEPSVAGPLYPKPN